MPRGTVYFDRSDQINQNSRAALSLPGVRVKRVSDASLYDVERSGDLIPTKE
jgi:hypothetical protein